MNTKITMIIASFATAAFALTSGAGLQLGWTAQPMSASGDTIRTDGELVWALAGGQPDGNSTGEITVNGVPFTTIKSLTDYPSSKYTIPFSVTPQIKYNASGLGNQGVTGDYAQMLDKGFWNDKVGEYAFTLNGLEAGEAYLVQIICHRNTNGYTVISPDGKAEIGTGMGDWLYGGSLVGVFRAASSSYTFKLNYKSSDGGAKAHFNAFQVRKIDSIDPTVIEPSIGSVTAKPKIDKVVISLSDVIMGTDDKTEPAKFYNVSYRIDGGSEVVKLYGQTGSEAVFELTGLEDGVRTCTVSVTTDVGKKVSSSVVLTYRSKSALDWTVTPMSENGDTFRTDGDLVFAYAVQAREVNGISFERGFGWGLKEVSSSVAPAATKHDHEMGFIGGDTYGSMLGEAWCWAAADKEITLTFKNLEVGEKYLVQIVSRSGREEEKWMKVSADGTVPVYIGEVDGDKTYQRGASLVGTFVAEAATQDVILEFSGNEEGLHPINALQLRNITEKPPHPIDPSIGFVEATASGSTATIVLKNVVMGTDDQIVDATEYSVYCKTDDGEEVQVLEHQTGVEASFVTPPLDDGSHTCSVSIMTDKGKTSEAKSITFKICVTAADFAALKAEIESAQYDDTVMVAPGTYLATSAIKIVQKNVKVIASGRVVIDGSDVSCAQGIFDIAAEGAVISGIEFEDCHSINNGGAINVNNNYHGFVAENCIFRNCTTSKMGGGVGGAFYYGENGAESPDGIPPRGALGLVTGCTFVGCSSTGTSAGDSDAGGGAIAGAFWIENSTFDGCKSCLWAPAIHANFNCMVTNCTFKNLVSCEKSTRGAVFVSSQKTALQVVDSRFVDVDCYPLLGVNSDKMLIDRCVIENCAGSTTQDGDMPDKSLFWGKAVVRSSLFTKGMNPFSIKTAEFENCTIVGNVGAFYIKYDSMDNPQAPVLFRNCVWSGNTKWQAGAYTANGMAGLSWHGANADIYQQFTFDHCALEGEATDEVMIKLFGQDKTGTTETLSAKLAEKGPKFTDPENGDYTLKGSSPLKDAGVLCDWMAEALDLAGNSRAKDGKVDLGCYERKVIGMTISVK